MAELKDCTTNFYPELCGVNVVIDQQQQLGTDDDRVLIIGQSTGTAADGTVHQVFPATRTTQFGADSNLNRMIDEFWDGCPTAEVYVYTAPASGTAGTADVTVTGVAGAMSSGVIYLWVNGRTYQVFFDPTVDTDATVAAKLQATINDPSLTVTVAANVVTITTIGTGEVDGFLDVRTSYANRPDLVSASDVTVAVAVTAATGNIDLSGLAAVSEGFEFVVNPYTDDNAIAAVSAYVCGQWNGGANSRAYGVFYGDASAAIVFGQNANNALLSYQAADGALTPSYLESAAYGCVAYSNLNCAAENIAASLTGQPMPAMLAPAIADQYTDAEKAALVEAGVGYFNVLRNNDVVIGRAVSTYTVANNGTLDYSLRSVNKPAMQACISRYFRERLTAKYTGYSFRADGIVGGNSTRVATIAAVRNYVITLASNLSDNNLVQDLEGFVGSLSVTIDPDTGCIGITAYPTLVEQFCCTIVTLRTI
jgi:phage tail sheath gpL-like